MRAGGTFGLDLGTLPEQFKGCVPGRTLLLDGDSICYAVASTVKRMDTAVRRYQQRVLELLFLTQSQTVRIHLTAKGCQKAGRGLVRGVKPYQGNRKGKAKPALLEPLREALMLRENWLPEFETVVLHREIEADDGIIQDSYRLKEDSVVWSEDKDLRMTPYPYFDIEKCRVSPSEPFGWVAPKYTPAGTLKAIGQGPLFFWLQMLMGDTADNVSGLTRHEGRLCGPARALEVLTPCQDIHEAGNAVLDGYRAIDQNPLPEGWMLWLLRWPGDNFWQYLQEINLSKENREFVNECVTREWFAQPEQCEPREDHDGAEPGAQ